MKYKSKFFVLFILGIGINYYLDTKDITYDFSVLAATLGAIAYLIGGLALLAAILILWGVGFFIRNKKLPDGFSDKFFYFGFWLLLIELLAKVATIFIRA